MDVIDLGKVKVVNDLFSEGAQKLGANAVYLPTSIRIKHEIPPGILEDPIEEILKKDREANKYKYLSAKQTMRLKNAAYEIQLLRAQIDLLHEVISRHLVETQHLERVNIRLRKANDDLLARVKHLEELVRIQNEVIRKLKVTLQNAGISDMDELINAIMLRIKGRT